MLTICLLNSNFRDKIFPYSKKILLVAFVFSILMICGATNLIGISSGSFSLTCIFVSFAISGAIDSISMGCLSQKVPPSKKPLGNSVPSSKDSSSTHKMSKELQQLQSHHVAALKTYSSDERLASLMGVQIREIVPSLFLANELAVGKDYPPAKEHCLKYNKITHILCCIPESLPESLPENSTNRTHYYFPEEFTYERMAIGDAPANATKFLQLLPVAFAFIEGALKKGGKVVVHCNAGNSRSPSVIIAYIMWKYKVSFEVAHSLVWNKRFICVDNFKSVLSSKDIHPIKI